MCAALAQKSLNASQPVSHPFRYIKFQFFVHPFAPLVVFP